MGVLYRVNFIFNFSITDNLSLPFLLALVNISRTYTLSIFSVIIMCANPSTIREIMLAADELNMVDSGEYVFFNIEIFSR